MADVPSVNGLEHPQSRNARGGLFSPLGRLVRAHSDRACEGAMGMLKKKLEPVTHFPLVPDLRF